MNLILLFPSDLVAPDRVSLSGRRLRHAVEVLKPKVNEMLAVGMENGRTGTGRVVSLDSKALVMDIVLTEPPPPKLPAVLCVALMRPIVLKRVLLTAASMGVGEIVIFHSRRVEKSFWQSTALGEDEVREQLVLGLEQAKDTVLPRVFFHKRFKPFVEDVLPALLQGRSGVVADPAAAGVDVPPGEVVLLVGPEGGFIPYELEKFREAGCRFTGLGKRILRVETAVVSLLSRYMYT